MDYALVILVALCASALTFFSGFGLGTLLMPAFAVFMPVEIAVGATALVHLANNLFKLSLVYKNADAKVFKQFTIPAVISALVGAVLLGILSDQGAKAGVLHSYSINNHTFSITIIKLVLGLVMVAFALLELSPAFNKLSFDRKYLPLGGVLSGFFGGLSGHQGALRSAFLIRCNLNKETFVATGVTTSVCVDCTRLLVYALFAFGIIQAGSHVTDFGTHLRAASDKSIWPLVLAGAVAALVGSLIGQRLVKKVTLRSVQLIVGVALLLFGIAMMCGLV
ncbi:MAG: sulfite exporter TauE/SafE family protein [Phycisphaerales bacterium]